MKEQFRLKPGLQKFFITEKLQNFLCNENSTRPMRKYCWKLETEWLEVGF